MYCFHCMKQMPDDAERCPHCENPVYRDAGVHHLQPGTVLLGKYLIGKAIGEGGFGITYVGIDVNLELKIAVKEYYPKGYANRNTATHEVTITVPTSGNSYYLRGKQKFLQEARTLAKFNREPNIVNVRDFFELNQTAYIIMDFVSGKTLKQYIKENGSILPDQLMKWFVPLLKALERVHQGGLIHRDISPDNILLEDGKLVLIDFGASRDTTSDVSLSVILKPGYAPGEQYYSHGNQGPWTDVYAMCATMYKCLTGVTPPESSSRMFEDTLKTPSELGISLPPAMEAAILRGLSNRYQERQQSMTELIGELTGTSVSRIPAESHAVSVTAEDKPAEPAILVSEHHMPEETEDDAATVYEPIGGASAPAASPVPTPVPEAAPAPAPQPEVKRFVPPSERPALPSEQPFVLSGGAAQGVAKKKSGKTFKIVLASVAVLAVAAVGIGIAIKNSSDKPQTTVSTGKEQQSQPILEPQRSTAPPVEQQNPVSNVSEQMNAKDALSFGQVTVGEDTFQLPCSYSDFTSKGWTLTDTKESTLINGNKTESASFAKGGNKITLKFRNISGDKKPVPDCKVIGLEASAKGLADPTLLKVGDCQPLSLTESKMKDIFGAPNDTQEFSSYKTYLYAFSNTQYAKFYLSDSNASNNQLSICFDAAAEQTTKEGGGVISALSDNLADFTFKLDGVCYQLPLAYQDLTTNGWVLSSSNAFETTILDGGKREYVKMSKAGCVLNIAVDNQTDAQQKLQDCTVVEVEMSAKDTDGEDYFQIAKSISPFSDVDDIIDAFGEANTLNEHGDYTSVKYYYNNDSISDPAVTMYVYQDESMQKHSSIKLTCSKLFEQKQLNTAMPEYLKGYNLPKELGKDYKSGNFELAGKVYHMPVPVDELLSDGWTFTSKPSSVPAGSGQYADLVKDGKKVAITLQNDGDYETIPENTIVRSITVYAEYPDQADLVLAGGFKLGMTEDNLKEIIGQDVNFSSYNKTIQYSWSNRKPNYGFTITVDKDTKKVTKVNLSSTDIWFLDE